MSQFYPKSVYHCVFEIQREMILSPFALEAEVVVIVIYESGLIVITSLFVFSVIRIICADLA